MKIFLNDRTVEFVPADPELQLPSDMVVQYSNPETLQMAWSDFKRYEKFKKLIVVDPEFDLREKSAAFKAFVSEFRFVPAAGGLVKNELGAFLFIHRLGFWDLPKGKIDKKDIPGPGYSNQDMETARTAAIREVKEETGLKSVFITGELPATWHIYVSKDKYLLKRTLWFEMAADSGQVLKPATREGIFLVKWTPPEAIHCILAHTYASIRELILEVVF